MKEEPLTRDELKRAVALARRGVKQTLFLSWNAGGAMMVTTIRLSPSTKLKDGELVGVKHDWKHQNNKAVVANCFGGAHALFDNYWMAYRHGLQAKVLS